MDIKKGVNLDSEPDWVHGVSGEVLEATELLFNYSIMMNFTASSRFIVSEALKDWEIDESERTDVIKAFSRADITQSELLVDAIADGYISELEFAEIDIDLFEEEGIQLIKGVLGM